MAKNTRLATTVTARYTPSVGAVDAFYLDGRISGQREEQFADITLDREDRGSFFAVYASSHGSRSETHNDDGNREYLDQIANDLKKNSRRNIDYEINELAECVVNVSGRLTLANAAIRQPYFSGVIIKDGEMAAITLGRGCAYLYRDETLYPLTQDEFPLEAIDGNGRKVSNMNDFAAGIAGTIRYSNIAQLKQDDCIIMCNKEVIEAVGQKQMLRILDVSEDQSEAAGMILDLAVTENPHVSMQFMIGFVEDVVTVDRLGRGTLAKGFTSRTTDRTGQKNNGTLFAGFEEPYKAPVASPVSNSASAKVEDDMADTKQALDRSEAAGLIAAAEAAAYQKMQANDSNQANEFDHSASRTDDNKDLSPDEAIDYGGFTSAADDAAPLYTAETADQFEQDSPLYADNGWDEAATLAYAGGYKDNDRNKKLAVIALAAVAVILLFFIIKTLVSGEEPGASSDNSLSLPGSSSSELDSSESELLTEDAASSSESVNDSSEPTEEPADSSSEAASESQSEEPTASSTPTATEAPTSAPTTIATTARVTSQATSEPTTAPTTAATTAPTTAPTTVAPTEPVVSEKYVVQAGDTLYLIALKIYDDPSYVDAIGAANGFDPEAQFIEAGQTLILPAATE